MAVADTREVNRTDPSICPGFSLSLSHSLALSLPDSDFQKDEKKLINIYKKKKPNTNGLSLEQMSSTILQLKIYYLFSFVL